VPRAGTSATVGRHGTGFRVGASKWESTEEQIKAASAYCARVKRLVREWGCSPNLFSDELPQRLVELDPFWIDQHEVTNEQFAEFVSHTNYRTQAEIGGV